MGKTKSGLVSAMKNMAMSVVAPLDAQEDDMSQQKATNVEMEKVKANPYYVGKRRNPGAKNPLNKNVLPEIPSPSKVTALSLQILKAQRQEEIREEWMNLVVIMDRIAIVVLLVVLIGCIVWFFIAK